VDVTPEAKSHTTQVPARTLLVLQIASRLIALPAESVVEIVPMAALSRLPGQPAVLEGFLNLRGAAMPVVRLSRLLDLAESEPGLYTPLAVLHTPSADFAVLADKALEIVSVPVNAFLHADERASFNACAEAQIEIDGRVVAVLSPERLLLEKERLSIAEFQARMERRLAELEAGQA
jgi:purine-binding chemotaxis protein CheW